MLAQERLKKEPQPLVVEDQREGVAALHDRDSATLYLKQWEQTLRSVQQELARRTPTLRQRFERARQWLMREQSVEMTLTRLSLQVSHLLDQLKHASDDHVTNELLQQIDHLQQDYHTLMIGVGNIELAATERESSEEQYSIQTAGVAKPRRETYQSRQLGRFGQDVIRVNREVGSIVTADGISSAPESFEVARQVSRAAEGILNSIPTQLNDLAQIRQYVVERLPSLVTVLSEIQDIGATTLLASRYLSWCDAVVTIDIGDCEQVLVAGDIVIELQTNRPHSNAPDNIFVNKGQGNWRLAKDKTIQDYVRMIDLAEYRRRYPQAQFHLVQSTDGIENNTGKKLRDLAIKMVHGNIEMVVAECNQGKDDIVAGSLTLAA